MKARPWLWWIAALYLLSLPLPAFRFGGSDGGYGTPGAMCLVLVPWVCMYPAWYANWVLLAGSISLARGYPRRAKILGVIATALALSFFPMIGLENVRPGSIVLLACPVVLAVAGHRPGGMKDFPSS